MYLTVRPTSDRNTAAHNVLGHCAQQAGACQPWAAIILQFLLWAMLSACLNPSGYQSSQRLRSLTQDREVTVIGEDAVAALASEFARDAQPRQGIHSFGRARKREPRPIADLV